MADKQAIYFRAKLRDLFSPSDPVVPSFLRLMAAMNDLRTLQRLWLYSNSRVGNTQSEQDIVKAENIYLFRLTCATVYETAIAFQDLKDSFAAPSVRAVIDRMPDMAQHAFHALANIFPENFDERTPHGKILARLRHSAFHYARPKVFSAELEKYDELGNLILGEIVWVSRYLLADDLQVQILSRQLGGPFEEQLRELMRLVVEVTGYFGELVDGMLEFYLRFHEAAIVEQRDDTVDPERLWKITP